MRTQCIFRAVCFAVPLLSMVAPGARASDLTILLTDKIAGFRFSERGDQNLAWVRVGRDPGLSPLPDLGDCSAPARVRLSHYEVATFRVEGGAAVEIPCEEWHRIPTGWVYRDRTASRGGIQSIRFATNGLSIVAGGPGLQLPPGPTGFLQATIDIGEHRYLIRLHDLTRNDRHWMIGKRATRDAAEGERAFWETLRGQKDRRQEAVRTLRHAALRDPRDGRAGFLEGMMHLYRFGEIEGDWRFVSEAGKREILAANIAFDRSVPKLWDGTHGDSRIPGFASAAIYNKGVAFNEAHTIQRGLDALDHAADINPLFNTFDKLGIAFIVAPDDPLYQEIIDVLSLFGEVANGCRGQSEICFNDGFAPHNLEGTFTLFGDIYAKGGLVEEARGAYSSALGFAEGSGWNPRFIAGLRDRLDNLEERIARYQDDDPSNDPILLGGGNGRGGGCAYCHED